MHPTAPLDKRGPCRGIANSQYKPGVRNAYHPHPHLSLISSSPLLSLSCRTPRNHNDPSPTSRQQPYCSSYTAIKLLHLETDVVQGLEATLAGEIRVRQLGTVVLYQLLSDGTLKLPEDAPLSADDIVASTGSMSHLIRAHPSLERVLAQPSIQPPVPPPPSHSTAPLPPPPPIYAHPPPPIFAHTPPPIYAHQHSSTSAVVPPPIPVPTAPPSRGAQSGKASRPRKATSARAAARSSSKGQSSDLRRAAIVAAASHAPHPQ
ncbi:hypothetical protein C8T65DRAFT_831513 [Cerioporus squamosus]|nr:hypothetical protein C8T65DRAFT_831513 [Cerioporus squamosus]